MSSLVKSLLASLKREGPLSTVAKIARYPAVMLDLKRRRAMFARELGSHASAEGIFTSIYANGLWGAAESVSGVGSTLKATETLRANLPSLIRQFSIRTVFDAPCGDMNWMKLILPELGVRYIGGDIVQALIDENAARYGGLDTTFVRIDLITDPFPAADLMICRDCLFHLSYADTRATLENFVAAGIPYLLTTNYANPGGAANRDIATGDFRPIYLFEYPYFFPRDPLLSIDDWTPPAQERQMSLWSRAQIVAALAEFGKHGAGARAEAGAEPRPGALTSP